MAVALCVGLVFGNFILAVQWSDPAYAKNGNSGNSSGGNAGGNGGGSGNAGGNAGGNSGAHSNAGGNGAGAQAQPAAADPDIALGLRNAGRIKPLAEVYAAAERRFGGEVIDAKLVGDEAAGWNYDVRVVTEDGHLHEVTFRAANLTVVSIDGVSIDGEPVE